jgi:hypothetical protein
MRISLAPLVTEVSHTCQHHHNVALIGRCDDLVVTHAAARLDDAARACINDDIESVTEGKKRI